MLFECWEKEDELSFQPIDHPQKAFLTEGMTLAYTIEADSWEDAMRQHHEKQGWEPYKPMSER